MTDADDMREAAAALFHPGEPLKPPVPHEEQLREATHNLFGTGEPSKPEPWPAPQQQRPPETLPTYNPSPGWTGLFNSRW